MEKMPEGTLVLVADGGSARTFRSVGDGKTVSLEQKDVLEPQNVNDDGPSGSQPPEARGSQTDEATFAKQLAHRLNDGALKNRYQHLVLIADPHTLGRIRPQLHKETLQRLHAEIAKTLTNAPLQDIERALG